MKTNPLEKMKKRSPHTRFLLVLYPGAFCFALPGATAGF